MALRRYNPWGHSIQVVLNSFLSKMMGHIITVPDQALFKVAAKSLKRICSRWPSSSATWLWVLALPIGWYGNGLILCKHWAHNTDVIEDQPIFWHKNNPCGCSILDPWTDDIFPNPLKALSFFFKDGICRFVALRRLCCSNSCVDMMNLAHY